MILRDIVKIIKQKQVASFEYYRDGNLTYSVFNPIDQNTYLFDIPIEDTKGGTFKADVHAISLMRWIRKGIENKTIRKL